MVTEVFKGNNSRVLLSAIIPNSSFGVILAISMALVATSFRAASEFSLVDTDATLLPIKTLKPVSKSSYLSIVSSLPNLLVRDTPLLLDKIQSASVAP